MSDSLEERLAAIEARLKRLEEQMLPFARFGPPEEPAPFGHALTEEERQAIRERVARSRVRR